MAGLCIYTKASSPITLTVILNSFSKGRKHSSLSSHRWSESVENVKPTSTSSRSKPLRPIHASLQLHPLFLHSGRKCNEMYNCILARGIERARGNRKSFDPLWFAGYYRGFLERVGVMIKLKKDWTNTNISISGNGSFLDLKVECVFAI